MENKDALNYRVKQVEGIFFRKFFLRLVGRRITDIG